MRLLMWIAEGIEVLFVGRQYQVVSRNEYFAGRGLDLPAFFHAMGAQIQPIAIIVLSSAHDLLA